MSYSPDQLLKIATSFEELASDTLVSSAKAKDKKKSDPKAKKTSDPKKDSKKSDSQSAKDKKSDSSKKDPKKPFWMFKKKDKKSSLENIELLLAKYAGE